MPSSNNRGISPPREAEKPRPGSQLNQTYRSDYRSVSPLQEQAAKPKPATKSKPGKQPEMSARLDAPFDYKSVMKDM
jgi:hypothetical protein